jgi:hypothetical protein
VPDDVEVVSPGRALARCDICIRLFGGACLLGVMRMLKPCVACGEQAVAGRADIREAVQRWVIACPRCGAMTESFTELEAAAACWNSRPGVESTPRASPDAADEEPASGGGLGETLALPA